MKSSLAVVAVILTVAIAGCDERAATPAAQIRVDTAQAEEGRAETLPPVAAPDASGPGSTHDAVPVNAAVPQFAIVYPNAEVKGEPLLAASSAGPGGVVTFVTDAQPDDVIAFYRERAEAAGLATMMSLNQGAARAYGAQKQTTGASVNVVAAPSEDRTSVQLTWSAGG